MFLGGTQTGHRPASSLAQDFTARLELGKVWGDALNHTVFWIIEMQVETNRERNMANRLRPTF